MDEQREQARAKWRDLISEQQQSGKSIVWCGDVADLVEPLHEFMAERVRASHVVATDDAIMPMQRAGKTANARMWV